MSLTAVACASAPDAGTPLAQRAEQATTPVLQAMVRQYQTCASFEDTGTETTVFSPDNGSPGFTTQLAFSIAFDRRTGAFRFEYHEAIASDKPDRGVIWRGGGGPSRMWCTLNPRVERCELAMAIAEWAGISRGTSYFVPEILLGYSDERSFTRGMTLEPDGSDVITGERWVKLRTEKGERELVVWIRKQDSAIRRIYERRHVTGWTRNVPGFTKDELASLNRRIAEHPYVSESTVDFHPVFGRHIDPAQFEFAARETPTAMPLP